MDNRKKTTPKETNMKKYINQINTRQFIKIICLLIVLLSITGILHAQPPNNGDPDSAPIDGGLSLLIAGGVGYGVKKIREKRKNDKL